MMGNHTQSVKNVITTCLLVFFMVCACSDDTSETTRSASSGSCAVAFDLRPADENALSADIRQTSALSLDCSEIATIIAEISMPDGTLLKAGGPWNCEDGAGIIQDVPAGTRGVVVVQCLSSEGVVVYRGESFEIDLLPGRTVSAGTIDAVPFVPVLMLPVNGESENVINGNVYLQWEAVDGAAAYDIEVTNSNPEDTNSPYLYATTETSYRTHDPVDIETQYYWRVRAVDEKGNHGPWTVQWIFQTDDNYIPAAEISSPADGDELFGNILFYCVPYEGVYDSEDGDNVLFEWRSSVDGVIGTSESVYAALTPGAHTITLSVTDQSGAIGYTEIAITVIAEEPALTTPNTWSYDQINVAGCDAYDFGGGYIVDIATNAQGSYDLTFTGENVCLVGEACTFSCTSTGNGEHLCEYAYEGQGYIVNSTIQMFVNGEERASGQGASTYTYDTECQMTYDISFIYYK